MKKELSNSRALRRRLLTAMITCMLAIIAIVTIIFNILYHKANQNVAVHTRQLASEITDINANGFYQVILGSDQFYVRAFGNDMGTLLDNVHFESKAERRDYVKQRMAEYFSLEPIERELDMQMCVGFIYADGEIQNIFDNDPLGDALIREASAALDIHVQESSDFYSPICGDDCTFRGLLEARKNMNSGEYTINGRGYIAAWDNLQDYTGFYYDVCYGMIDCNVNWYKKPIGMVADEQAGIMTGEMDTMFRHYFYLMIVTISAVMLVFVIVSVILSKKLADPVVSEHDMLVQLNEMKTTFLSDASHELKTPLAALSGYAQNAELDLLNGGETALIQEKLRRISSEANRMALMVTQILDATRIEEGRMVLEMAPCDLEKLVRETVETYFAVLNKNNNRLALRIPLELPAVQADSSRLQRVFVNLISNALKHTHNGMIVIKAEQQDDCVQIAVKDTGSGISPEDMEHIWERYYKGKHAETGTGLGLFICKFIVESHGGKIWAESEVGKGTTFLFRLPLSPA